MRKVGISEPKLAGLMYHTSKKKESRNPSVRVNVPYLERTERTKEPGMSGLMFHNSKETEELS